MVRKFSGRVFACALAMGVVAASLPLRAQISNSKHNLLTSGPGLTFVGDPEDLCVFCHTPIGVEASAAVPQWNRTLPSPATYQTYDMLGSSTLVGRVAPVGSVSLLCLSCHDGTQAMSSVINSFRSGWTTGTRGEAFPWGGRVFTGASAVIATDLRNDHPVGVQYGGGGITASSPSALTHNPDFRAPQSAVLNETRVWWVGTGARAGGTRQKTDLMLYTRTSTDGYTGQTDAEPFVECASCHDPHTDKALFLRISNAGSALCLACHTL